MSNSTTCYDSSIITEAGNHHNCEINWGAFSPRVLSPGLLQRQIYMQMPLHYRHSKRPGREEREMELMKRGLIKKGHPIPRRTKGKQDEYTRAGGLLCFAAQPSRCFDDRGHTSCYMVAIRYVYCINP